MNKSRLKERILEEMVIKDAEAWILAKEIYKENRPRLKIGVTLNEIYERILELKKEMENDKE